MEIIDLVAPERVIIDNGSSDRNQLLQRLCRRAALDIDIAPASLLTALRSREELGSTGMGAGIALPHVNLRAVSRPYGLFARLNDPIDFNAADARPVDLVFLLLLPSGVPGEHLGALSCVARLLRRETLAAALRQAGDPRVLYELLTRSVRQIR